MKERWSRHHSLLWKSKEKEKESFANQRWIQESITRGEGISVPNTCPRIIPLIK